MGDDTATSGRAPLGRDAIVRAGVELADAEGVAALSMRKLARSLGYEVMSLYNHVANKDELLAAMVDEVAVEIGRAPDDLEPLDGVRVLTIRTHEVLVAHPWAPELWQRHLPGPARNQLMEDLLRLLADSGLSPEVAHHGFHAVNNHVLGYTLAELGMALGGDDPEATARAYVDGLDPETFPLMRAHVFQHLEGDTDSSFELVLDLILDGLVRLDAER